MEGWLHAIEQYLNVNGPTEMGVLGNKVTRPAGVECALKVALQSQPAHFTIRPYAGSGNIVHLSASAASTSHGMVLCQADARRCFTQWLANQPQRKMFGVKLNQFFIAHPEAKNNFGKLKECAATSGGRLTFHPNANPAQVFVQLNAESAEYDSDYGATTQPAAASSSAAAAEMPAEEAVSAPQRLGNALEEAQVAAALRASALTAPNARPPSASDGSAQAGPSSSARAGPSTTVARESRPALRGDTVPLRSRTLDAPRDAGRGGTLETKMADAERRRQLATRRPCDDAGSDVPAEVDERVWERFYAETPRRASNGGAREVLFGSSNRPSALDSALFGRAQLAGDGDDGAGEHVYLNVSEPFCLITIGVQGSGKSHTVAVVAESCLLRCNAPTRAPLVRLREPAAALVLHYGRHESDACELAGLFRPADAAMWGSGASTVTPPCVERAVVLVSPSFYAQRKRYYGEGYDVRPLLFRWHELTAAHLRMLMRLDDEGAQQLYISVLLDLLRRYQQADTVPEFEDFVAEVQELCGSASQAGPLRQRLQILKSFIFESERNTDASSAPLDDLIASGALVVADLTDPLLSAADASAVFGVLLEQFRRSESMAAASKLVVLDEAHRYLHGRGGLVGSLVDAVRMMRHEGLRVCVSTQSPLELPPELLELASLAVLHGFHSKDWYTFLASKLDLPDGGFEAVRHLLPGEALVSARCLAVPGFGDAAGSLRVQVRPRLTSDLGASRST